MLDDGCVSAAFSGLWTIPIQFTMSDTNIEVDNSGHETSLMFGLCGKLLYGKLRSGPVYLDFLVILFVSLGANDHI